MSATEWEKIKALFDAALAIPREMRTEWLDNVCGGGRELRATLEKLLENYDESSDSDLRQLPARPVFNSGDFVANRFYILRLIASGGMGEVYEARDSALDGLRVALKTIRTDLASELRAYERFKREVWVAREMSHEGICRIYDLVEHRQNCPDGSEGIIPCLTMKLLDGENLATYLATRRPLQTDEALPILRQVIHALAFMHTSGVVHRDLKPSNIMLVQDAEMGGAMRAVITDFGLAKPLSRASVAWETRIDQQAGAPYFLAPEILGASGGGIPSDIYSLGLVMDEMVTRSPAFPHESIEELFWKKLHRQPVPPPERADNLPQSWDHCIRWCLQRDPERRPGRVTDLLSWLAPSAEVPVKIPPPFQGSDQHINRRTWVAGTAAALVVSAAALSFRDSWSSTPKSVLVGPFENATGSVDYNYVCTGTADDIVRRLASLGDFRIFANPERTLSDPVRAQSADFSLEGTLEQYQENVRLTLRLTDNAHRSVIWSDQFHRVVDDLVRLETEIGNSILPVLVERLRSRPTFGLAGRILAAPVSAMRGRSTPALPLPATNNAVALTEYMLGRSLWQERTQASALAAIVHYKKAIAIDPRFALAYAALADAQITLLTWNQDSTTKLLADARAYAEEALRIAPELPEVRASLAVVNQNTWDWAGADAEYSKALELRPRFARARHWYAGLHMQFGRFDEALAEGRRASQDDPLDYPIQSAYGVYLWNAGRLVEAASHVEALLKKKDLLYAHVVLGQVYAAIAASSEEPRATEYFTRSLNEAGVARTRELETTGGSDNAGYLKWSDLVFAQAHAARRDFASAMVYTRRLEHGHANGNLSASAVAWAHAASGNHARTLELLEIGLQRREREMLNIKVIPLFRPLHSDSRFQAILKTMNL